MGSRRIGPRVDGGVERELDLAERKDSLAFEDVVGFKFSDDFTLKVDVLKLVDSLMNCQVLVLLLLLSHHKVACCRMLLCFWYAQDLGPASVESRDQGKYMRGWL